jgi:drug/metabolite transporter (DMT)-like permease
MQRLLLVIGICGLTVLGELLMRQGMWRSGALRPTASQLARALRQWRVLLGLALAGVALVTWLLVITPWQLSYAFSLMSLTYILVVLLAWWFLGETLTLGKGFGTAFIILGMWLVGPLHSEASPLLSDPSELEIALAIALLLAGGLIWLTVISRWQISYAYPLLSFTYIVMLPVAWLIFGQVPLLSQVVGALIILLGIMTVVRGGQA